MADQLANVSASMIAGATIISLLSWKIIGWTYSRIKIHSYNQVRKEKKDKLYNGNFNWIHQVSTQVGLLYRLLVIQSCLWVT